MLLKVKLFLYYKTVEKIFLNIYFMVTIFIQNYALFFLSSQKIFESVNFERANNKKEFFKGPLKDLPYLYSIKKKTSTTTATITQ